VNGFYYWHFLRFEFFDRLITAKAWILKPARSTINSGRHRAKAGWNICRNSLSANWRSDSAPADLLVLGSDRRVRFGNRIIEPYTDLILDEIAWKATQWEAPYGWKHRPHDTAVPVVYMDSLFLEAALKMQLRPLNGSMIRKEAGFLRQFASTFGVSLEEQSLYRLIMQMAFYHEYFSQSLEARLLRKKVRMILMVNHYEPLHLLISGIAKKCGIYVVELQHGNLCRYHIGYNFAHEDRLETLPHEIFTYGEYWQNKPLLSANGVRLTVTGMPYYESRTSVHSAAPQDGLIRILIISQESLGLRFAAMAMALARRLDPNRYRIVYKLHPREYDIWEQAYPESFRSSGVEIAGNVDLYSLLSRCDFHVGAYSTTIIESLGFGKRLILLEGYGAHYFSDLIGQSGVSLARNDDDVLKIIQSGRRMKQDRKEGVYWEKNSLQKIVNRMGEILD